MFSFTLLLRVAPKPVHRHRAYVTPSAKQVFELFLEQLGAKEGEGGRQNPPSVCVPCRPAANIVETMLPGNDPLFLK